MLCQQSKLPRGTCKELPKSANLRTYEAFAHENWTILGGDQGELKSPTFGQLVLLNLVLQFVHILQAYVF
jgi:hypothetical protein